MTVPDRADASLAAAKRWFEANSGDLLSGLLAGAFIVALMLAVRGAGRRAVAGHEGELGWRIVLARVVARTSLVFIVVAALKIVGDYAALPPRTDRLIQLLWVVAAALQAAVWLRELLLGTIEARASDQPELHNAYGVIRLLVSVALFAIAVILILSNLGVNVTGLLAGLGIGGIAIGLAAQGIFSDLFAALSILFDRPFRRGETIRFGDVTGTVEAIGLKTTRLRALEGDEVVIANAKLLDQQIRNLADVHDRRVLLTLPLLNRNDPAALAALPEALRSIVEAEPDCRFGHAWLASFGPHTADMELVFRVETDDIQRMMEARHRVMLAVLERVKALGIELNAPWPSPA